VLSVKPLLVYEVALAASCAISPNAPGVPALSGARSTRKPSSLFELSVQVRSIDDTLAAAACRLAGAAGATINATVVAFDTLE
jgi:hypothetical protein